MDSNLQAYFFSLSLNNTLPEVLSNFFKSQLKICRLSGLSNHVYKLEASSFENPLVFHHYSQDFKLFIDHSKENQILEKLYERNLYDKVLFADSDKRIEDFYPGLPIDSQNLDDIYVLKQVLNQLSFIHSRFFNDILDQNEFLLDRIINNTAFLDKILIEINKKLVCFKPEEKRNKLSRIFQEILSSDIQKKLSLLLEKIKSIAKELAIPNELYFGYCHNDLNNTNILQNPKDLKIRIMDYEYSSANYLVYEFANMFNEMAMDYNYPHPPFFQYQAIKYPDKDLRFKIFQLYCYYKKFWSENKEIIKFTEDILTEKQPSKEELIYVNEEYSHVIEGLEKGTQIAIVFSNFFWFVIAGLSLNKEDLILDFYEYILKRYEFILIFLEGNN